MTKMPFPLLTTSLPTPHTLSMLVRASALTKCVEMILGNYERKGAVRYFTVHISAAAMPDTEKPD